MKEAIFIGSALEDLRDFPRNVRRIMGAAINDAQEGDMAVIKLRLKAAASHYAEHFGKDTQP